MYLLKKIQLYTKKLPFIFLLFSLKSFAGTPILTVNSPSDGFINETFCFDTSLTNTGTTGYGPYLRLITKPGYTLTSASFLGGAVTPVKIEPTPALPTTVVDTNLRSSDPNKNVTVPADGDLYLLNYPIGSLVAGQPALNMAICLAVDVAQPINSVESSAFSLTPVYRFGDRPTGITGDLGATTAKDFTPKLVKYRIEEIRPESERPPGPQWHWPVRLIADVAKGQTLSNVDFSDITPLILAEDLRFYTGGANNFTDNLSQGAVTGCSGNATPLAGPNTNVSANCTSVVASAKDVAGVSYANRVDRYETSDVVIQFEVYSELSTLSASSCAVDNEQITGTGTTVTSVEHFTIQKSSSGSAFYKPGDTVTFTLNYQVSQAFGVTNVQVQDTLPDGLTFVSVISGPAPAVLQDTPANGQTRLNFSVGALAAGASGTITYTATVDAAYANNDPIRSRDTLTNNVVSTYDVDSVGGATACSNSTSSTIEIVDVSIEKQVLNSSNVAVELDQVKPGDTVVWRLTLNVPSGDIQGLEFEDFLPLPVFNASGVNTNTAIASNPDIAFGPDSTITANPSAITIDAATNSIKFTWPDVSSVSGEVLQIDISTVISNAAFDDGLILSNMFKLKSDRTNVDGDVKINLAQVELEQPKLSLSKIRSNGSSPVEAGEAVNFDITVKNIGRAPAYDIIVKDTLPSHLKCDNTPPVITGGSAKAGNVPADIFQASGLELENGSTGLAVGQSVKISFFCVVELTAVSETTYTNTASASWSSGAGVAPTQRFSEITDTAQYLVNALQLNYEIASTSESISSDTPSASSDANEKPLAQGEVVRYRIKLAVPKATTNNIVLNAALPQGLTYLNDGTAKIGLLSSSGTALNAPSLSCSTGSLNRTGNESTPPANYNLDCPISPSNSPENTSGGDPSFNIGSVVNSQGSVPPNVNEYIIVEFNAVVDGTVSNNTDLDSVASVQTSNKNLSSNTLHAVQANPDLAITKSSEVVAGGKLKYTLRIEHTPTSLAASYDNVISDVIPASAIFDKTAGIVGPQTVSSTSKPCSLSAVTKDTNDPNGTGIKISFAEFKLGELCEFNYYLTANLSGQPVNNNAKLDFSGLPNDGTNPNPTGSSPGAEFKGSVSDSESKQGTASLSGNAWLDKNTDDSFGNGEKPLEGWKVQLIRDGVVIAEVPVNPDGSYKLNNIPAGLDYSLQIVHPESGVVFNAIDDVDLAPGQDLQNQNLPIDPSGIFYDSVERQPIAGVKAYLVDENNNPLSTECLLPNQQGQVTGTDGMYRFDVVAGASPSCPTENGQYFIIYEVPDNFTPGYSTRIFPQIDNLDPTGLGNPYRVGDKGTTPIGNDSTKYFIGFDLSNGDPDVIWNHIPVDPLGAGAYLVRLTKKTLKPKVVVGDLVPYSITVENLFEMPLRGIDVQDVIPAGFSFVEGSATILETGKALDVTPAKTLLFKALNFLPEQKLTINYLLRVGVGVTQGNYTNTATPLIRGKVIGNTDTAKVVIVADPDFEDATIIGKVWNDRDGDGWQDAATAHNIMIKTSVQQNAKPIKTVVQQGSQPAYLSERHLSTGVTIDELKGLSVNNDKENKVVITTLYSEPVNIQETFITTREGKRIIVHENGKLRHHNKRKVDKRTSQSFAINHSVKKVKEGYAVIVELVNLGQDEPGIPGVRLATVEGLVIETDANGRYHIAAVDGGLMERGRSAIVKVDPASLPKGSQFTTENPRVKRITQGLLNRFDFGVQLPLEPKLNANSGHVLANFDDSGAIWISEDPMAAKTVLSVSAAAALYAKAGRLSNDITFNFYSNYSAFVDTFELAIYSADDVVKRNPIQRFTINANSTQKFYSVTWNSKNLIVPNTKAYVYQLTAKRKQVKDITIEKRLLVLSKLQDKKEQPSVTESQLALTQHNDLHINRIPVSGSLVKVHGQGIAENQSVIVNGETIPVNKQGDFTSETILPLGRHQLSITLNEGRDQLVNKTANVDVNANYHFMLALADLTASDNKATGAIEALSGNERYAKEELVEGRLALFLKGKIKGKYLIAAQMDTGEQDIKHLFDGIDEKDPRSIFRRIDPDRYYPVYGDDSKIIAEANSQGRMYVRVNWDRSQALWGNYKTGFTGTELQQYDRGLYGAKVTFDSVRATKFQESKSLLTVFASENETSLGHTELLGTGSSLYYLRHTDVLPGSETVRIEVRDENSSRVLLNKILVRGKDYEMDDFQGRIILSRPLMQTVNDESISLITDSGLNGNQAILIADYEYVADDTEDNTVLGVRAKQWLNDHIGVGMTYVDEQRSAEDYQLAGMDVTLRAAQNTWLEVEYGETEATQANRYYSIDGGLSFSQISNAVNSDRKGDGLSVAMQWDSKDYSSKINLLTRAWFKKLEDSYSIARRDDGVDTKEYGIESVYQLTDATALKAYANKLEKADDTLLEAGIRTDVQINNSSQFSLELQRQEIDKSFIESDATLAAIRYSHNVSDTWKVYIGGQVTVDKSDNYRNNDQLVVGTHINVNDKTNINIEVRDGHRGDSAKANIEYQLNEQNVIYGTSTLNTDNNGQAFADNKGASLLENQGINFALGHRWESRDGLKIFTEGQYSHGEDYDGQGRLFGVDYQQSNGWFYSSTLQQTELTIAEGIIDREAYSVGIGFSDNHWRWKSRFEYREDEGARDDHQWLSTSRLDAKINEDFRFLGKVNFSESESEANELERDARLTEASLGVAYRPHDHNRFNGLAKYTFLYDLQSYGQNPNDRDQRSHVFSMEGVYRLNPYWDVGGKLARRVGELRAAKRTGSWYKSSVNFAAVNLRWHVISEWDAMLEYRLLELEELDQNRQGALLGVYRHLGNNFKLGIGYNFTDFSDDLTDLDYDHKGWFINAVGKF